MAPSFVARVLLLALVVLVAVGLAAFVRTRQSGGCEGFTENRLADIFNDVLGRPPSNAEQQAYGSAMTVGALTATQVADLLGSTSECAGKTSIVDAPDEGIARDPLSRLWGAVRSDAATARAVVAKIVAGKKGGDGDGDVPAPGDNDAIVDDGTTMTVGLKADNVGTLPQNDDAEDQGARNDDAAYVLGNTPDISVSLSKSVAPATLSDDSALRARLDELNADPSTDASSSNWKALAELAMRERDAVTAKSAAAVPDPSPVSSSGGCEDIPSFTSRDLVLDPTQRWTVPVHRPPVCITNRRPSYDPSVDQTALIGTLLSDAADTSVGSIMPRFQYAEENDVTGA